MKILTLLRHAKSSWSDTSLSDHDRPLNRRGNSDAPDMALRLHEAAIRPSLILSSPAVRAWTTAKIVAQEISYPIEFLQREADLYLAGLSTLIRVVSDQDEGFNSILLVGHNPGLTEFANYLCPDTTGNLPTSGIASFAIDSDDWNLSKRRSATLDFFDYPKKHR